MVAYEVETEDLAGIGTQLRLQADDLVATREAVGSASLGMLHSVAAAVTATTGQVQQLLADLETATTTAGAAAGAATWTGPDADIFRAAQATLLTAIAAADQRLREAMDSHAESTATLDAALQETLGAFGAEAGRNHDLTTQLAQAVDDERASLEQAFDGSWTFDGRANGPGPEGPAGVDPAPAAEPAAAPQGDPAEDVDLGREGLSLALGLIPGVGTVKGVVEAVTGKELITGRTLAPWERALGVIPYAGKLGGAARVLRGADRVLDAERAARTARSVRAGVEETRAAAAVPGAARRESSILGVGDPVDVATGRVFLSQTDVALPGSLPLVIGRRHESGYRLGRSFGPSWATVLDERIQCDAHGAMLVRGDGATLSYPTPEPGGAAVLPEAGTSRWPLRLDTEGVFRVEDPVAGRTFVYRAAPGTTGEHVVGEHEPAWLVRVEDRAGQWWSIVRDAERDGVPLLVVHHGGYRLAVRTDDHGRVLALDAPDPDGGDGDVRLGGYGYDDAGHLAEVVTATGGRLRFDHDQRGRLTGWTDSNDQAYDYRYDDADRCVRQGAADGVMAFSYAYAEGPAEGLADGLLQTVVTDPLCHERRYVVQASTLLLVAEVDPLGGTTRYSHDSWGNPLARTDPDGVTTSWTWDELGRPTSSTDPLGHTTTLRHDAGASGRDLVITGPDGAAVTYRRDDTDRVTAVIDASGALTSIDTEPASLGATRVVRVTDPLGGVTTTTLDPAGLPVEITDAAGGTTSIVRDGLGRPVEVTDPVGTVTRTTWRIDGRPLTRSVESGSEVRSSHWAWDGEGNCVRSTDPAGRVTLTEFGPFDRPVARIGPDGSRIEIEHDGLLRPVRVVDQLGHAWTFAYDAAGNVIGETDYAGRRLAREYDPCGRVRLEVNGAGQTRSYTYDPAGRLDSIVEDAGITSFGYDPAGRLVRATAPEVTLTRTYDVRGLLTTETVSGATTSWRYDAAGRLVGRTTPAGVASARDHDAAGRLVSLATAGHRLTVRHDLAGRELARAIATSVAVPGNDRPGDPGAGVVIGSTWTPIGRLASRDVRPGAPRPADGTTDWSVRYGYTPAGELTERTDTALGTHRYELDAAGRVTAVGSVDDAPTAGSERYDYDLAGNLVAHESIPADGTGRTATGRVWAYLRGRLIRAGRDRFRYDEQGRLVRRRRALLSGGSHDWTYTWDAADRLTQVTTPDGSTWHYRYDPFGRRIGKRQVRPDGTTGERVTFVWEGAELIEQTTTGPDTRTTSLTWDRMPDGTPATHTVTRPADAPQADGAEPGSWDQAHVDSEFYALVTDLVGAPIRAIRPDGEAVWVARPTVWDPAGDGVVERGVDVPLRFPGQYADAETGLAYNRYRYYDPETARYISPDPLGLAPAPNPYTYPANPTTHVDPSGLAPCQASPTELHAFGNASGPRPPRAGIDYQVGADGLVVPQSGPLPRGASTFADPAQSGLSGVHHSVPEGTHLPPGFGVVADGIDVVPGSPHPPTHHTIYPTEPMTPQQFHDGFTGLPWTRAGRIR